MIDLGRRSSERYLKLVWLAPLIPLVWETDATAVLWLGSTALALLLFRSSRAPTLALVYKSTTISILIGICVGTVMALLINPNVDRLAEHLTGTQIRSEEHTSELQSLMRISYAVFCLTKKTKQIITYTQ